MNVCDCDECDCLVDLKCTNKWKKSEHFEHKHKIQKSAKFSLISIIEIEIKSIAFMEIFIWAQPIEMGFGGKIEPCLIFNVNNGLWSDVQMIRRHREIAFFFFCTNFRHMNSFELFTKICFSFTRRINGMTTTKNNS